MSDQPTKPSASVFEQHIAEAKDYYAEATTHRDDAINFAESALKAALLCGHALIKARDACPPRQWIRMFREYFPDLAIPTAYKWIALAKNASLLDDAKSKHQAYRAIGLLPEIHASSQTPSCGTSSVNVEALERWASRFEKLTDQEEQLLSLPDEEKSKVIHALEPAAKLHAKLVGPKVTLIDGDSGKIEYQK